MGQAGKGGFKLDLLDWLPGRQSYLGWVRLGRWGPAGFWGPVGSQWFAEYLGLALVFGWGSKLLGKDKFLFFYSFLLGYHFMEF